MNTKSLILTVLALFAINSPIVAQQSSIEASNPILNSYEEWRAEHGEEWRLRRHTDLPTAQFLWGYNLPSSVTPQNDGDFEELARQYFADTYSMFGVDDFSLSLRQVKHLDLSRIATTNKVSVEFAQKVNGIEVLDGSAQALFTPKGDLLALDSLAMPHLNELSTRPKNDGFIAVSTAISEYIKIESKEPNFVSTPELVILKHKAGKWLEPRLAWSIELRNNLDLEHPAGRQIYIAADNGRYTMLEERNLIHHQIDGTIDAYATPGTSANSNNNPPTLHIMPYTYVNAGGAQYVTDINGEVTIPGSGSVNVSTAFRGPYCRVYNQAGGDHSASGTFTQGGINVLTMNTSQTEFITSEASCYDSVNDWIIWARSIDPTDTSMEFQVRTNANLNSNCNAYFDGSSINMYRSGSGCSNTGFSTVVAHEEGHWANVIYNSGNGSDGFGEGMADVWSMYIYDTPIVGEGFFTSGGFIRTGTNTRQYCGDGNNGCYGQVHTDGEVLMGALWKVRVNLNNTLGNTAGDLTADTLMLAWMNAYNDGQILSIIEEHWLVLDDDNGNIGDGTPNYADIDAGFRAQGFPGIDLDLIDMVHTPLTDTLSEAGPYTVSADISSLVGGSITSAEVTYTVNGGAPNVLNMNNTAGNTWVADIPGQISPARVEYHITANDSLGNSDDLPRNAEFSFIVGVVTQIYFNDFEGATDEGWTHAQIATQDDWMRGTPNGSVEDPAGAFQGSNVWGNDLAPSGYNGSYASNVSNYLESPSIDCSGRTGVKIRFARWLTVEEGIYDQARIQVNGTTVWENPANGNLIDTAWSMQEVDISSVADNNPNVRIRFSMESDSSVEFGGWNIDVFEVLTIDPVPGGGTDVLNLSGDTIANRGGQASHTISGMPANARFALFASLSNTGTVIQGKAFDIGNPYKMVTFGNADANGNANTTINIPTFVPANTIGYLEAGALTNAGIDESNILTILLR